MTQAWDASLGWRPATWPTRSFWSAPATPSSAARRDARNAGVVCMIGKLRARRAEHDGRCHHASHRRQAHWLRQTG